MPEKKYLIVVGGPTASGKTSFAIRLARHFRTEILSCDSRQFFREMTIGTAKPSVEELLQVTHHFIDRLSVGEQYSVGDYERDALALLEQLFADRDVVILTGGSGLYIQALCRGLDDFPEVLPSIRADLESLHRERGIQILQEELRSVDPKYYEEVDLQNPHRLIRALEVYRASGRPFSSFRTAQAAKRFFTPIYLQLHRPRPLLYQRIDQRVDHMLASGLEQEARDLYEYRSHNALQTVGYQEFFDHFAGKTNREEAIDLIKRNTRRYAKRQLTWMRREGHWRHLDPSDWEPAIGYVNLAIGKDLQIRQIAKNRLADSPAARLFSTSQFPLSERDTLIFATLENRLANWILLKELKGADLLYYPRDPGNEEKQVVEQQLLHEAKMLCEQKDRFFLAPQETKPLLAGFEFEAIDRSLVPELIRSAIPAALQTEQMHWWVHRTTQQTTE